MRKNFAAFAVTAIMTLGAAFSLTACGDPDPHAHVWDEGSITTEATCTQEGEKTFNCTVKGCKETNTESIGKAEHEYESEITTQPDCGTAGVRTYTCKNCDASYTEAVDKSGEHSWNDGELTVTPSLTTAGSVLYTCTVCNSTKNEAVAARDDFGEQFYTALPSDSTWAYGFADNYNGSAASLSFVQITQTDSAKPTVWKAEGVEISENRILSESNAVVAYSVASDMEISLSVKFGGAEENTRVGASLIIKDKGGAVHDPVVLSEDKKDWEYTNWDKIEAKSGDTLYIVFSNNGSGKPEGEISITVTTPCVHVWNDGVVTTESTCHSDGVITITCDKCKEFYTVPDTRRPSHDFTGDFVVNGEENGHRRKCVNEGCTEVGGLLQHNHNIEKTDKFVAPTCHSDGKKYLACECGHEIEEAVTDRPAHAFTGAWVVTADGHQRKCTNDGCTDTSALAAHDYKTELTDRYVPAECDKDGKKYFACECSDVNEIAITDRPAHNFEGAGWLYTAGGHYKECNNCHEESAIVAHTMIDNGVQTEPTNDTAGVMNTKCEADCGYTSTREIPSLNHRQSETYASDETSHWFICAEHTDCGVKFEEKSHEYTTELTDRRQDATCEEKGVSYWQCVCGAEEERIIEKLPHNYEYVSDGADGHHQVCGVCETEKADSSEQHNLLVEVVNVDGVAHGNERTYCEKCDYEVIKKLTAIYRDEFNADGTGWSYGYTTDYNFATNEFTFNAGVYNAETGAYANGDANIELKNNWVNVSGGMAVIGYTFGSADIITASLRFTGEADGMKISLRFVLVSSDGVKKFEFIGTDGKDLTGTKVFEVAVGDILYAVINKEADGTKGNVEYEIAVHKTGDWVQADNEHYKVCTLCNERLLIGEHYSDNKTSIKPDLYNDGKIEFNCEICGKHVLQVIPARADFKDDFTLSDGQEGAWSYGKMENPWDDNRHFVQSGNKNEYDAWIADGVEIKAGWINASDTTTIGYTANGAVTAKIKIDFKGSEENTLLAIRIYRKNGDRLVQVGDMYTDRNDEGRQIVEIEYEFAENETVYIMFSNEHWDGSVWQNAAPNGDLGITITKVA